MALHVKLCTSFAADQGLHKKPTCAQRRPTMLGELESHLCYVHIFIERLLCILQLNILDDDLC